MYLDSFQLDCNGEGLIWFIYCSANRQSFAAQTKCSRHRYGRLRNLVTAQMVYQQVNILVLWSLTAVLQRDGWDSVIQSSEFRLKSLLCEFDLSRWSEREVRTDQVHNTKVQLSVKKKKVSPFKGDGVRAYIRGISKYKMPEQRRGKWHFGGKGEEINGELWGGVMVSVTLRHVLLAPSSLILCVMALRVIYEPLWEVCVRVWVRTKSWN